MEVGVPTHIARLLLKRNQSELVDGIDVYVNIEQETSNVDLVWEEVWEDVGSKYRGEIDKALTWIGQMANPFYIQLVNPFRLVEKEDQNDDKE